MSICAELSMLSPEIKQTLANELLVTQTANYFTKAPPTSFSYYRVDDTKQFIYLPFYKGCQVLRSFVNDKKPLNMVDYNFIGQLRAIQEEKLQECFTRLSKVRCAFLAFATGKGKTISSLYVISKLRVKVLVFLHMKDFPEIWKNDIKGVMPTAKVQHLKSDTVFDPSAEIYLINPQIINKRDPKEFADIGLVIADEADALCTPVLSQGFFYVQPRYLMCLSATPKKKNGMDKILDLLVSPERIAIKLEVPHVYYKFETNLVPTDIEYVDGKVKWETVLRFQQNNLQRNIWIVQICKFFPDRNIIVLCKRKEHVETLHSMLEKCGEEVEYRHGDKGEFNVSKRILISTFSKSGRGFNHPKLDMFIIAGDVEELFEQYFGRCVRRPDSNPIVVDIVDKFKNLEKHYKTRRDFSIGAQGTIKNFRDTFPEFFEKRKIMLE